jgi:hypothetical protein
VKGVMLGPLLVTALLAPAGASPSTPPARGLVPVQRFDGLDEDGHALRPTADEVVVVRRWFSHHGGIRVSLVGLGERADAHLPSCGSHDCVRNGQQVVVSGRGIAKDEQVIQAHRPGTTAVAWMHSLGPANVLDLADAGEGIQALRAPPWSTTADGVLGLDAEGAVVWQRSAPADAIPLLETSGNELLMLTPQQVHIADAATGTTRQVVDVPGGEVSHAFATPTALLVARGDRRPELLRIARRDGAVSWRARTPDLIALLVVDELVVACTAGDDVVVHALDDGRRLGSYGPGFACTSLWSVPVAPGLPARVMAADREGALVIFELDPDPPPPERYTIRGRVLLDRRPQAGVRVHVGDRSIRTDAEGRYRVFGRGRGAVHIWVELPDSPRRGRVLNFEPEATVELSGKHWYQRDLVTHTVRDDH